VATLVFSVNAVQIDCTNIFYKNSKVCFYSRYRKEKQIDHCKKQLDSRQRNW